MYCKSYFVSASATPPAGSAWTFFTNHAHVLLCIAQNPDARMRDVAERVGITERAVQRIIEDLAASGYLAVEREGRRNRYRVHTNLPLRHPVEAHCAVSGLIDYVLSPRSAEAGSGSLEWNDGKGGNPHETTRRRP